MFDRGLGQILYWFDVHQRVFFKLAVTIYRCLNGHAPLYPMDYCIPVTGADTRRHLRSANCHLLAVPRFRINTYDRRTFSVAGSTVWNCFPDFTRDPAINTDCFRYVSKHSLDTSAFSALRVL